MQFQMVNRTRTAEAELTEIMYEGEMVGTIFLIYSPDTLEGFSQVDTELLKRLTHTQEDQPDGFQEFNEENLIDPDNWEESVDRLDIDDLVQEIKELIADYVRNQAAAANKKIIQVKHCYGTWTEEEQLEFKNESAKFPEVNETILNQFQEAEVNDVKIVENTNNLKIGYLINNSDTGAYQVGRVIIRSRGTTNRVRIEFWVRPTQEITFHAATLLTILRGQVAGGRVDYYYNKERLRSAIIPSPQSNV